MPSQALADLSAKIESQKTDSFGKFYMYAALLNTLTVRRSSFLDALPRYSSMTAMMSKALGKTDADNIHRDHISAELATNLENYKTNFKPDSPTPLSVAQKIFLSVMRKGQLSDLVFIVSKMQEHLRANPMANAHHNHRIFSGISFEEHKKSVEDLLDKAQRVMQLAQKTVDSACFGVLAIIMAAVAMKITLALGSVFLLLTMVASCCFLACHFFNVAVQASRQIKMAVASANIEVRKLINHQIQSTYAPNHLNFIIKSILVPITYIPVTVGEQLEGYEPNMVKRKALDTDFDELCQLKF